MKKTLPILKTDEEAEKFVDTADLSEYDLSAFKKVHFEFLPKDKTISLNLPSDLLAAIKLKAKKENIPYNRLIRRAVEREVGQKAIAQTRCTKRVSLPARPTMH